MSEPVLRVRASGYGGSGYQIPTRDETGALKTKAGKKHYKVPGVTTVLDAIDKPGLIHWHVANTAAFAVANADLLAERDIDWGFKYLQYYTRRKVDYDDPIVDLHNYSTGVLDDLASTGTIIHDAIEAYVNEHYFGGPEFTRQEQVDAFNSFVEWAGVNDVEFEQSEVTVLNPEEGYAGTLDLIMKLNGKRYLVDIKTSRYTPDSRTGEVKPHDAHISQVAALANATRLMVGHKTEQEGAHECNDLWWEEADAPTYDGYAILQVRPTSIDDYGTEIPAFTHFYEIPERVIEAAYGMFKGALQVRKSQVAMKQAYKQNEGFPWG